MRGGDMGAPQQAHPTQALLDLHMLEKVGGLKSYGSWGKENFIKV